MAELTNPSSGNSRGARSSAVPRVDLTAMVDLAFLLITFFMLTTTLAKQNGIDLSMPVDDDPQEVSAGRSMTVCLGDNTKVLWYMGTQDHPSNNPQLNSLSGDGIRKALMSNSKDVLRKTGKGLIVLIKPSDKSVYGDLVNILDEMKVTEVPTYAIVEISDGDLDMMRTSRIY
ncbi:biopolymer transporter ExbD [Daejeonella sp.]|uniref:ExbD/TolR family protein n=1 Tax=Daejeonella sp. TaxID=2805397 RepID=UPI0030C56B15